MKTTELRLGNICLFNNNLGTLASISDMSDRDIWYKIANTDGRWGVCEIKDVKPIPLTEQRMKDFRFEKHFVSEWDNGIINIKQFIDEDYFEYFCNNRVQFRYVHTFQNLYFILTGKELTTTSFK